MRGTITQRTRSNGKTSWGYIFWGPDQNGKRRQITKGGFAKKKDADDALEVALTNFKAAATEEKDLSAEDLLAAIRDFKERRDAPPAPSAPAPVPVPTFEEFFTRWIKEHAARRCSPKTLEGYQQHGAYAIREFGSVPINELTAERLEMAMNHLQDCGGKKGRPLSPKTIRHIFFAVSGSLKKARKWHLVERNMMEDVDRPAKEAVKPKPKVLDNAGIKQLLDRAESTRLYPLLVLAASTGMRRGELLALQWSDLNRATGILQVTKSLEETNGGLRIKSTKSGEPRSFSVPAAALTTLEHHREEQDLDRAIYGASYEENDLIFCRPDGTYYRPDQMSARVTQLARKSGLPGIGLHSLRHSHASQLISSGTPITVIAERLGHANSAVTLSIYSHALPADVNAAAEVWNTAMANTIQTERKTRPARMLVNVSGKHPSKTQVTERKTG